MKELTKKIKTIQDCKTPSDVREGIESIIGKHSIMQSKVNNHEFTYSSMIESLKWFLDPVESEGRKDDS